jgi:hypothetical protein
MKDNTGKQLKRDIDEIYGLNEEEECTGSES